MPMMDLGLLQQLEHLGNELAAGIKTFVGSVNNVDQSHQTQQARRQVMSSLVKIEALVSGPAEFLEHLAIQCEVLACVRWLGDFQILACIPPTGNVPIKDVAELSQVPEGQLARVIRLTARAGFLSDSKPEYVAHTPQSASFVAEPSYLDAAMFLAESVAPAALQAAAATQRVGESTVAEESAFNLASNSRTPFHVARARGGRLDRQWSAFLQHVGGLPVGEDAVDALMQLNWSKIGKAGRPIVEVGAQSSAESLAPIFPSLHFLVQLKHAMPVARSCPDPHEATSLVGDRITVSTRQAGTRQPVTSAAVYLLHLPSSLPGEVLAELHVHLTALRTSAGIMIVLVAHIPDPDDASQTRLYTVAHTRNLILYQLTNQREIDMPDLLAMIDTVRDDAGRLKVVHRLRSSRNTVAALVVKYQLASETPQP